MMKEIELTEKRMSRPEAALRLGISVSSFDREFRAGRIPYLQIGMRPYFTENLLNEYLRRSLVDGSRTPSAKAAA